MRFRTAVVGFIALASLAACGGYTASGPYGGGTGGGQGGGGPVGAVTLGPGIQFVSSHNGSQNSAVDTIPVGGTVTWTWTGSLPHGVESMGSSSFSSSGIKTGSTTGRAEPSSIKIVQSPSPGFDGPVTRWALRAQFRPARLRGRAVRVLIQLPIDYSGCRPRGRCHFPARMRSASDSSARLGCSRSRDALHDELVPS
jgi:hypothetical protein